MKKKFAVLAPSFSSRDEGGVSTVERVRKVAQSQGFESKIISYKSDKKLDYVKYYQTSWRALLELISNDYFYSFNSYFPANITPILSCLTSSELIYVPQLGGFHKLQSTWKNLMFRLFLRVGRFHSLRCISKYEYQKYREMGIPNEKLFYCPFGIDYEGFSKLTPYYSSKEIFSIANARKVKNLETQIKAVKELSEEYPKVKLNIIGGWETESYQNKIESLVEELELERNVVFHGYKSHDEIREIMSKCSLCVHTSKFESQGLSIYEAAAAGFPICISDVPVHNQNFERFKHPQEDFKALAEDIKTIFEMDEGEKRAISEEMKQLARNFSYEKETERLEKFFKRIGAKS